MKAVTHICKESNVLASVLFDPCCFPPDFNGIWSKLKVKIKARIEGAFHAFINMAYRGE